MKKSRTAAKKRGAKKQGAKKQGTIARLRAAAGDPMLSPHRYFKVRKKQVTLRVDADVLAWFRNPGRGYQTRMNRVLRKAMTEGETGQKTRL